MEYNYGSCISFRQYMNFISIICPACKPVLQIAVFRDLLSSVRNYTADLVQRRQIRKMIILLKDSYLSTRIENIFRNVGARGGSMLVRNVGNSTKYCRL
jgi:hypothetical protein